MTSSKPFAFVIMPFDDEFYSVYEQFLKPVLEDVGFRVYRADDILSQQSIVRDVVERLHESDLIVADLSGENPNVFYELGLAHAFGKPVILLTQSIEEIPFNLRSYRHVKYDTRFAKIDEAKAELAAYAKGFLDGNISFGTPVTDFRPPPDTENATAPETAPTKAEDDRGFVDHLISVTEGYSKISQIVGGATLNLDALTRDLENATGEFEKIAANSSNSAPTASRNVSRRLAERIAGFNSELELANASYAEVVRETENSLEVIMTFQAENLGATDPRVEAQRAILQEFLIAAVSARDTQLGLADQMDSIPRFERRLNRELVRGSELVRTMANNIDTTIASINRALRAGS